MKRYMLKLEGETDDIYEPIFAPNYDAAMKQAEDVCAQHKNYSFDWLVEDF